MSRLLGRFHSAGLDRFSTASILSVLRDRVVEMKVGMLCTGLMAAEPSRDDGPLGERSQVEERVEMVAVRVTGIDYCSTRTSSIWIHTSVGPGAGLPATRGVTRRRVAISKPSISR